MCAVVIHEVTIIHQIYDDDDDDDDDDHDDDDDDDHDDDDDDDDGDGDGDADDDDDDDDEEEEEEGGLRREEKCKHSATIANILLLFWAKTNSAKSLFPTFPVPLEHRAAYVQGNPVSLYQM